MNTRRIGLYALAAAVIALIIAFVTERGDKPVESVQVAKVENKSLPDTLRAVTLYGPTSYFSYRDEQMGLDYEMLRGFAKDMGIPLKLEIASGIPEMLDMLKKGKVDLIAYDVPRITEYAKGLKFCGKNTINHQVLVQPKKNAIHDVTQLIGKTVYVEKDSKYQYRLSNLNDEMGGGIGIEAVVSDTLETADLIRMVSEGELPLTVTDSEMADICREVFDNLDVDMAVGMDQYSSWAVDKDNDVLAQSLDKWMKQTDVSKKYADVHRKYFEHLVKPDDERYATQPDSSATDASVGAGGVVSRFDAIFKKYAAEIGWDWRQLAAIGYTESKFNPEIVSWAGARGLMQLMPSTARTYGVADRMNDPDASVYGASRVLRDLDKSLQSKVSDPEERRKFVIASYNSGLGHILDAMALASKYGKNPQVWYGNVREMALLKTKPQYYNDPVVKHGYFRGTETVNFVDRVLAAYDKYRSRTQ